LVEIAIARRDAKRMRALDVAVVEGRGEVFADPGATVRIVPIVRATSENDDDGDRDDGAIATRICATATSQTARDDRDEPRTMFREEFSGAVTTENARALARVTGIEIFVTSASGRDAARGAATLDADALARLDDDDGEARAVVRGTWCEVREIVGEDDGVGATVGRVCARVTARGDGARTRGDGEGGIRERRTAREGATTTTTTAAVRAEIEGGGGERAVVEAGEGGAAATATATPAPRRENVAAVAAGWLRGVVARGRRDDGARERERERKRREREAEIEEKRARKERDRIERERVEAAKLEREAQLEAFRAAERDRRANDETASGGGARDVDRGDASQPGSPRRSFHIPNVEEIKQRVSEGAHQLGEVAHQLGDRLRDTGDKIAHNVNEQAHHVKDALRDTNNRVGKALAKKRWVRDIAARLSPNSILVVAIAIALAGLPENRDKARRKAQSVKKRIKETRRESSETAKAKKKTASEEEEDLPEVIYNELADPDEDTPFIGRGPTPRGVYEVVEGDTLCSIAGCFNLDLMEIIDKNGDVIRNPDALAPGDRIRIY
jgi:hypothetical protein